MSMSRVRTRDIRRRSSALPTGTVESRIFLKIVRKPPFQYSATVLHARWAFNVSLEGVRHTE